MYTVTIKTGQAGSPPLKLRTGARALARAALLLCTENKLECVVVEEREPRPVRFR